MARQYINLAEIMGQVDNARANESNIKRQQQQMQMEDYAFRKAQEQDNEQTALRDTYRGSIENGALNEQKLINDLMQRGYGEQALALQEKLKARDAQLQKNLSDAELAKIGALEKKAAYGRNTLAGASPSDYTARRQHLIENGFEFAKSLPEQYDPEVIKQSVMDADNFIKQLTQERKPPTTRTIRQGADQVTQEFDAATGKWNEIGRGGAFAPEKASIPSGYEPNPDGGLRPIKGGPQDTNTTSYSNKPLPSASLKLQNETLDKLSIASNNSKKLLAIKKQIEEGKLKLGPISNLTARAKNYAGMSDESSRNLSSFKSTLEKLRNDSLRLNTGVQTDGDAQRAWNELFENINDPELVKQRLGEIAEINARGAELQKIQVENIRNNYNLEPIDFIKYENIGTPPSNNKNAQKQPNKPALNAQDQKAIDWAKKNPNDARAKSILKLHGM